MMSMTDETFAYWSVFMRRSGWMRIGQSDSRRHASIEGSRREDGAPNEYGSDIVWEEFHMTARCRC